MLMIRSAMPFTSTSLTSQPGYCSEHSKDAPTQLPPQLPRKQTASHCRSLAPQKHRVCQQSESTATYSHGMVTQPRTVNLLLWLDNQVSEGDCYLFIPVLLDSYCQRFGISCF